MRVRSFLTSRIFLFALLVLSVIGFAPLISVIVAGVAADHFGCRVDEGSVHPCAAFGTDIGGLLYHLGVMGWLMLITWPLMLVAAFLWLAVAVSVLTRRRARPADRDR